MPTMTTVSGLMQDAGGNVVTSGRVQFEIASGQAEEQYYRITGTAILVPNVVNAVIDSGGHIVAEDGLSALQIWGNNLISPSNSWYRLKFSPVDGPAQITDQLLIQGTNYSLNSPTFYDVTSFVPDQPPVDVERIAANVVPITTGQYTLGDSSHYYASAYIQQLFVSGQVVGSQFQDLNVKMLGAVGDGIVDDTLAVQAALSLAAAVSLSCFFPSGKYRVTATLTIGPNPVVVYGNGRGMISQGSGTVGKGAWIYVDHTGKGFTCTGAAGTLVNGIEFRNIGIYRNQPASFVGWAPTANDYDIWIRNCNVIIKDVILLNPTKGVWVDSNNQNGVGQVWIDGLYGQAFQTMVRISESVDVCRLSNIHSFPIWSATTDIYKYCVANLDVLYLERCDNPMIFNIFGIYSRSLIRIGHLTGVGTTTKIQALNIDADASKYGIWVDSTHSVAPSTGQFTNFSFQAAGSSLNDTTSRAIYCEGSGAKFEFSNFESSGTMLSAIECGDAGGGNILQFEGNVRIDLYDISATNVPAIAVADFNEVYIYGTPTITNGGGTGGSYGGATTTGTIGVDDWRTYTPVVTASIGTITTVGTVAGKYKQTRSTVEYEIALTITTNGTGAGVLVVSIPAVPVGTSNAIAQNRITSVGLVGVTLAADAHVYVSKYDGTYPAIDGSQINITGRFKL
jgi:hypothetical protein